jgi:hypothetical protein
VSEEAPADTRPAAPARTKVLLRRVALIAGAAAALAIPVGLRVAWEGRAELDLADLAAEDEDVDAEIEHLGRAARWRIPVLGHDEEAIDRLLIIGTDAESRGGEGRQTALAAYREARGALLSTRTWGVPQRDVFDDLNTRIATLMAEQEADFGTDVGGTGDPYTYHLALLDEIPGPDPWRANFAALAFVGWIVATVGFVLRAIDARGHLRPRSAVRWGVAALLLLAAWAVLLRYAG